jgi:hypothetical protein
MEIMSKSVVGVESGVNVGLIVLLGLHLHRMHVWICYDMSV